MGRGNSPHNLYKIKILAALHSFMDNTIVDAIRQFLINAGVKS
jgi:hypothetical protein